MAGGRQLRFSAQPGQAHLHQFAASRAVSVYPSRSVWSYIPKNACSALRLAVARANGHVDGPEQINWIHANAPFTATLAELATASYSFVILRCPFRRLASCFLNKIVGRYPPYWVLYPEADGWVDRAALSFADMVEKLSVPGYLKAEEHWRPQADFLVYRDYDDWFALEDFEAVADRLWDRGGLELTDTRALLRHGQDQYDAAPGKDHSHTAALDILTMQREGECPTPQSLYTDDLARRVAHLYRFDIQAYVARFGPDGLLFPHLGGA